jgi:hypothetical protein
MTPSANLRTAIDAAIAEAEQAGLSPQNVDRVLLRVYHWHSAASDPVRAAERWRASMAAQPDVLEHELADICSRLHENEPTAHDRDVARLREIGEDVGLSGPDAMRALVDAAAEHCGAVREIVSAGWEGIPEWHPR